MRRVVYTSSAATIGEAAGTVGSEESPHRGRFLSHYERSKYEAERVALATAAGARHRAGERQPGVGAGPRAHARHGAHPDRRAQRAPLTVVDSRMSLVDVSDCAEGHLLAEERGVPGERYLLSGVTLTVTEALALLGTHQRAARSTRAACRARWRWPPRPAQSWSPACAAGARRCAGRWCARSSTATPTTARGPPASSASPTRRIEESLRRARLTGTWPRGSCRERAAVVRPGRHHAADALQLVVEELLAVAPVAERDGHEVERREAAEHRRHPHQRLADDDLAPADAHRQQHVGRLAHPLLGERPVNDQHAEHEERQPDGHPDREHPHAEGDEQWRRPR